MERNPDPPPLELSMNFSDCKGNDKLHYEVSSPYFKVNNEGGLVALRNITAVGKTLFVHARTPHAEDMAELVIVGGKDIQGSLQVHALNRNRTRDLLVHRSMLYPLSQTGFGFTTLLKKNFSHE
ncbi:Cadherin-13 [Myotis davidii]|uniref:Cadherin-13 n=1 Tax=Myotis davidii TaxID=225400 RepID=L5LZF7_MYODS|nr:Cadherin-13 [Myotis davidii]